MHEVHVCIAIRRMEGFLISVLRREREAPVGLERQRIHQHQHEVLVRFFAEQLIDQSFGLLLHPGVDLPVDVLVQSKALRLVAIHKQRIVIGQNGKAVLHEGGVRDPDACGLQFSGLLREIGERLLGQPGSLEKLCAGFPLRALGGHHERQVQAQRRDDRLSPLGVEGLEKFHIRRPRNRRGAKHKGENGGQKSLQCEHTLSSSSGGFLSF